MKLTKHKLKEIIREVIREEKQLNEDIGTWINPDVSKNPDDYTDKRSGNKMDIFYNSYSSGEAKKVVEKKEAKQLKITKPNGKIVYRENLEGLLNSYKSKGWKVEEV